jgi:hypothetical protein
MTYSEFKAWLKRTVLIAVLGFAVLYAADYLLVKFRVAHSNAGGGLGGVTVYPAATLKSGKEEIFFDQPQTKTCVNSLFPHFGYSPCWYARRSSIQNISSFTAPSPKGNRAAGFEDWGG